MSLRSFVQMKDVRAQLNILRPKLPRKIGAPLKVPPRSNHFGLIGTAFDYLLRIELQRRAPHAVFRDWVADLAADRVHCDDADRGTTRFMHLCRDEHGIIRSAKGVDTIGKDHCELEELAKEVSGRVRSVVESAKFAVATYLGGEVRSGAVHQDLAAHSIRLAKLDAMSRGVDFDPTFEMADSEDVRELVEMLAIVPFDLLLNEETMLLNPVFGDESLLVGGADADLIAGHMLVDFKVTKNQSMDPKDLDQLLGYFFLARRHRQVNVTFPPIERLGLYYCRHGILWVQSSSLWTNQPAFDEIEKWFFQRAAEVYSRPTTVRA